MIISMPHVKPQVSRKVSRLLEMVECERRWWNWYVIDVGTNMNMMIFALVIRNKSANTQRCSIDSAQ